MGKKRIWKGKAMKGGTFFSEENCEFLSLFTVLLTICLLNCVFFFWNLIQKTGIGRSWKYPAHMSHLLCLKPTMDTEKEGNKILTDDSTIPRMMRTSENVVC